MFRNLVFASFVLMVTFSITMAEEFMAVITKVDGNNVTFAKFKRVEGEKKGEKGEATTLPTATDVKINTGKFNREEKKLEVGETLEGGLSNERFKTIGERGVMGRITTDDDGKTIKQIIVMPSFRKKKDA